jgi:hypothetical protein
MWGVSRAEVGGRRRGAPGGAGSEASTRVATRQAEGPRHLSLRGEVTRQVCENPCGRKGAVWVEYAMEVLERQAYPAAFARKASTLAFTVRRSSESRRAASS